MGGLADVPSEAFGQASRRNSCNALRFGHTENRRRKVPACATGHHVREDDALWPGCQHSQNSDCFPALGYLFQALLAIAAIRYTKDIPNIRDLNGDHLKRKKTEYVGGKYDITIESIVDDSSRLHDYGFSRATWYRGVRLMRRLGPDQALELMDIRADRALARGDIEMCHKWRDLMGVIHAIESEEPQPTDRIH